MTPPSDPGDLSRRVARIHAFTRHLRTHAQDGLTLRQSSDLMDAILAEIEALWARVGAVPGREGLAAAAGGDPAVAALARDFAPFVTDASR